MSWEVETVNQQLRKQQRDLEYVRELNYSFAPGINISTAAFGYGSSQTAVVPKTGFTAYQPTVHGMGAIVSGTFLSGGGSNDQISLFGTTAMIDWSGWVSGQSYTVGQIVRSTLNTNYYKCTNNVTSTTDPSADGANWTLDNTDSIILKTINGTLNDGQIVTMKPKQGRTLILRSGGNLNVSSDITVTDQDVVFMQYFQDGSPANHYNVVLAKAAGTSGFANVTLSNLTSPTSVNQDLLPNTDLTGSRIGKNIGDGSAKLRWGQGNFGVVTANSYLLGPTGNLSNDLIQYDAISNFTRYNADTGHFHDFQVGFVDQLIISNNLITVFPSNILPNTDLTGTNLGSDSKRFAEVNSAIFANANAIIFGPNVGTGSTRWVQHSGGLVYNVLTGESHSFQVNFVESFNVRAGNTNVTGLFTVSGTTNLNGNVHTDADNSRTLGTSGVRFIVNGANYLALQKGAPTPSVLDVPSGYFQVMKDTRQAVGVGIHLWYNDAGTLVQLV